MHAPVGFLFLQDPPIENIPIPYFRTSPGEYYDHPSPDLLETVYICQQKQEWCREFARAMDEDSLLFVGSAELTSYIESIAYEIRRTLGYSIEERRRIPTWTDTLRLFIDRADSNGILVM
jgi:hypothetical protein